MLIMIIFWIKKQFYSNEYYDSIKISKKYSKPYQKAYSENENIKLIIYLMNI